MHIPDTRGVMAPAKDLAFNDAPWVPDQRTRFVHARLSHQVLRSLHYMAISGTLCSGFGLARLLLRSITG